MMIVYVDFYALVGYIVSGLQECIYDIESISLTYQSSMENEIHLSKKWL